MYETSAVGGDGSFQAAVKVLTKLAEIEGARQCGAGPGDVICDANVAREIAILTQFIGTPGVIELLSWSEGHFDVHLVFPMFPDFLNLFVIFSLFYLRYPCFIF